MTIHERLRDLRKQAGLSCAKLAERSGVHAMTLYAYERGKSTPTLPNLIRICEALGVTLAAFAGCPAPSDKRIRSPLSRLNALKRCKGRSCDAAAHEAN